MKYICIIFLLFLSISCSTNKCIETYIKEESQNKKETIIILVDRKIHVHEVLKKYKGVKRGNFNTQPKSFNQKEYDLLYEKYKNDTLIEYLNKNRGKNYILLERAKKQGKPYNKKEYETYSKELKNAFEYWNKRQSNRFGFNSLVKTGDMYNHRDSIKKINPTENIFSYRISKPIFIRDKKMAMFAINKSKGLNSNVEDCLIIMQKTNGEWVFVEKVISSTLH